jgi:uncharacterized membrane protein YoaK (UPF0700 family)
MDRQRPERDRIPLALALAWVAGSVDAIGYLTLAGLFTAHMSGNSARLGVRLGQGDLSTAVPLVVAVALFVLGVALGATIGELAARRRVESVAAVLLLVQAALLAGFLAFAETALRETAVTRWSGVDFYVPAALAILSMGVQLTVLQQVAGVTVRTTYVSGLLTRFAQESVEWLLALRGGRRRLAARARALLLISLWFAYAAGATVGALADGRWGAWALVMPLALLLLGVALDVRKPLRSGVYGSGEREGS